MLCSVGGELLNRRYLYKSFRNGKDTGSFATVRFDIVGHTDMGKESIKFETDIHYLDIGEGDPVLFIHGIGQSLYTWRNNLDFFARNGFRVIAVDLPGFGYSGHPNIYYTAEEYALVTESFIDALNLKRVNIVACSGGGIIALCFAAVNPKRTGKLVLISPGGPNANYPFSMKFLSTWLGGTVSKFYISESAIRNALHSMFFDATLANEEVTEGYYAPFRNKNARETLSMCMTHFDDEYTRSLLKGIKSETLIFHGTEDKLHGEKSVNSYASVIPKASLIRIRNCGHLLHEEKPAKFNEEAQKFLCSSISANEIIKSYGRAHVE